MSLKLFSATFFRVLAAVAACFALAAAMGCSSSSGTLEEYYDAHPEEWQKESQIAENDLNRDVYSGFSVEVKGNNVTWTFQLNYDFSEIDAETQKTVLSGADEYFRNSQSTSDMMEAIKATEEATKINGITNTIVYADNTGREIISVTYDANGIV